MKRYEYSVLSYIQHHMRNSVFDVLMPAVSLLGNFGFVWIVLMLIMFFSATLKLTGLIIFLALVLHVIICNWLIKPLFSRLRPMISNEDWEFLVDMPGDPSFPSGHTCSSFAVSMVLYLSGSILFYPAIVLASMIAFSRLYLFVHYPTDVLAGIALGCGIGYFSYFIVMVFV